MSEKNPLVKRLLSVIGQQTLWPVRARADAPTAEATVFAGTLIGILAGLASAAVYVLASAVLPARVAIALGLLVSLSATVSRSRSPLRPAGLSAPQSLCIGIMFLIKLETLTEIGHDWVPLTLICSCAWARASVLSVRPSAVTGITAASAASRLSALIVGLSPLLVFGVWPDPIWGLWVAALVTLLCARWVAPRGWAAPLSTRWICAEMLFCICVLVLLNAAALAETAAQEEPAS